MRHYFQEIGQGQDAVSNYPPEQLRRTIVQEILMVMDDLGIESADLDTKRNFIDDRLQGVALDPTGFQWAAVLEPAYPEKTTGGCTVNPAPCANPLQVRPGSGAAGGPSGSRWLVCSTKACGSTKDTLSISFGMTRRCRTVSLMLCVLQVKAS